MAPEALTDEDVAVDPQFKAQWIDALRSGSYKQTSGCLRSSEDFYCCLGVALDLKGAKWRLTAPVETRYITEHESWGYPVREDRERLGLAMWQQTKLADMNDNGVPFTEIADWIEGRL